MRLRPESGAVEPNLIDAIERVVRVFEVRKRGFTTSNQGVWTAETYVASAAILLEAQFR